MMTTIKLEEDMIEWITEVKNWVSKYVNGNLQVNRQLQLKNYKIQYNKDNE